MTEWETLPTISYEQHECLETLRQGNNLVVQSVPGSGKTTLILMAVRQMLMEDIRAKILVLAYNTELVGATNRQLAGLEMELGCVMMQRVMVTTYHSLLSSLSRSSVENELVFLERMEDTPFEEKQQTWSFADFNKLIFDETQDTRLPFFQLMAVLTTRVCRSPQSIQILAVGDTRQLLYDFYAINRADARFLTDLELAMKPLKLKREWEKKTLTVSYRLSGPMAHVINTFDRQRTILPRPGSNNDPCVTWILCDLKMDAPKLVLAMADREKNNVLVLCRSLNERCQSAINIVDCLVDNNIKVHVSRSGSLADNFTSGAKVNMKHSPSKNKVCLKTFHAAKGIQSPVVIVLLQCNIFQKNDRGEYKMDNAEYVGLTRASRELIVLHDYSRVTQNELDAYLDENKHRICQRDIRFVVMRDLKPQRRQHRSTPRSIKLVKKEEDEEEEEAEKEEKIPSQFTCNSLFSFIDVEHMRELLELVQIRVLQMPLASLVAPQEDGELGYGSQAERDALQCSNLQSYFHQMNITFDQGNTFTNVANICGTALVMALEVTTTKTVPTLLNQMLIQCAAKQDDKHLFLLNNVQQTIQLFQESRKSHMDIFHMFKIFAKMATLVDAFYGYGEKIMSLRNYDFIEKANIFDRFRALRDCLGVILKRHSVRPSDLVWYQEEVGRFRYDSHSVKIITRPSISAANGQFCVEFLHKPETTHDDLLTALTAAQIIGNKQSTAYIINIGDAAIYSINLAPRPLPTSSSMAFEKMDISSLLSSRRKSADTEDIQTLLESRQLLQNEASQKNFHQETLHFISQAITFKILKEPKLSNEQFFRLCHRQFDSA